MPMISPQKSFGYISQGGPSHDKHKSWKHPFLVVLVHYGLVACFLLKGHDYFHELRDIEYEQTVESRQKKIGAFLIFYFLLLLCYRVLLNRSDKIQQIGCVYECTWLCNSSLFFGAIGLLTGRHILVQAHMITVSIDQVLWYVDLAGYAIFRKFPVGVAKYLTWPNTTIWTNITCTHHVWTIPLLMYATDGLKNNHDAYIFSAFVMTVSVLLSRWMTPFYIQYDKKSETKYLNVNLSHELWKDIKFSALQIQHDNPSTPVYLFRLLWRWQLFNGVMYLLVLRPLSSVWF